MSKYTNIIKLQIKGKATPAPPIGPILGQKGINIQAFCKRYNDMIKDKNINAVYPVIIGINPDKSFDIIIKEQPVAQLLLDAIAQDKGSSQPGREMIGHITMEKIKQIATKKMHDMSVDRLQSAEKIVIGTAKSMGIQIN